MVQRWRPEVFAYFEYPATNAITENRNGLIKMVNRQGRGYTFDVIRAKALLAPSLGRMSECFLCHGEFPANSMRSLSDIKVRGNGRQAREDREMFARLTSECCTNCHHMFANFHSPEARMRWEIGASSPEEFAAMSDEQIRAVMRRNIERSSYNPYEDY
jgi:hypothetical protein